MVLLPNLFTFARLVLAPFVAVSLLGGNYRQALILCLMAGLSDAVDGFLARKLGGATLFGAYLDPIADKILLTTIYICLGSVGLLPWWMVGTVFGRDLLILGMVAWGLLMTRYRKFPPTIWGKLATFLQIAAALVVMASASGIPTPVTVVVWSMVIVTVASGVHYAVLGLRMLRARPPMNGLA